MKEKFMHTGRWPAWPIINNDHISFSVHVKLTSLIISYQCGI